MIELYNTVFYEPLYNALVFLIGVLPWGSVGLAVIILTLFVKFVLFPFAHKSVKTQHVMRGIEPELKEIKSKKLDRQQEAVQVMELYKKHGVNPFSGCLLILIQIPIIFALYLVFLKALPDINQEILYSFVSLPETVNMHFLWFFDLDGRSVIFALLAGITQYFQMKLTIPPSIPSSSASEDGKPNFRDEFAKNLSVQMRYVLPGVIMIAAYTLSAAIALYWITNNLFSVAHEYSVRRKAKQILEPSSK